MYDMIASNNSYNMALVRANLPFREINAEGNVIPREEAYSRIPIFQKLANYQSEMYQTSTLREESTAPSH
jgi:hypothetical protein